MLKKLKLSFIGIVMFAGLAGGLVGATIPTGTAAAADCNKGFLTFPPWYKDLPMGPDCSIQNFGGDEATLRNNIWKIVLNVIEIVLQIIGYIAVFFVIYGGFLYMTSSGNPDGAARGLKTIINASVGIALGLSAIAVKNLLWKIVVGSEDSVTGIVNSSPKAVVEAALGTVYFIMGAIAVIMIIISGLTYITSSGNASKVAKAKNSLLYAVIGLIVVIAASGITKFVLGAF